MRLNPISFWCAESGRLRQLRAMIVAVVALFTGTFAVAEEPNSTWLDLEVGKSFVLEAPKDITAIAITDPDIADMVTLGRATRFQIQGKSVGSTDLVIQQGPNSQPIIYEITVHKNLSELIRRIDAIVDGTPPKVYPLEGRIVAEGNVDDLDTLEKITQILRIYDEDFVNLMSVRGDHQVQLEVVFAEVSRAGLRELGFNALFGGPPMAFGLQSVNATPSASVLHPYLIQTMQLGNVAGAAANGFHLMSYIDSVALATVLSVLDDYKMSKVLAKPNLTSLSGQESEFQVGGEVPIISSSQQGQVKIEYKPYGVIVSFVPTVLANNVIDVRVGMEVSELDPSGGIQATGIEVPGLITRKAKSHMRLESGMTFAIAGMIGETTSFTRSQIPILGQVPIFGALFRYVKQERAERELMIFVTPRLVRPLGADDVPAYPGANENSNPTDFELFLLGLDHKTGSRVGDGTPKLLETVPGDIGLVR